MIALNRRSLLKYFGLGAHALLTERALAGDSQSSAALLPVLRGMPPFYCLAYIDPSEDLSSGQVQEIARFPMAIVPQDDRRRFLLWKDELRKLNPDIVLLAYQMAVEETTVPGPGHRALARANGQWVSYGGLTPSHKSRRFYDPRSTIWQQAFVDACTQTLSSYGYDGLFLDQCSVFTVMAPLASDRAEMIDALQATLLKVRDRHGKEILVANSRLSWRGLNGEMNEGMPGTLKEEAIAFTGHVEPRVELFFHYISENNVAAAEAMMQLALANNAMFGCAPNAQTVRWYRFFDTYRS